MTIIMSPFDAALLGVFGKEQAVSPMQYAETQYMQLGASLQSAIISVQLAFEFPDTDLYLQAGKMARQYGTTLNEMSPGAISEYEKEMMHICHVSDGVTDYHYQTFTNLYNALVRIYQALFVEVEVEQE